MKGLDTKIVSRSWFLDFGILWLFLSGERDDRCLVINRA
jgi:hypothetical protein